MAFVAIKVLSDPQFSGDSGSFRITPVVAFGSVFAPFVFLVVSWAFMFGLPKRLLFRKAEHSGNRKTVVAIQHVCVILVAVGWFFYLY